MKIRRSSVIIGIAIVLILWSWVGYNRLVSADQTTKSAWTEVKVQEQRRFDLIPNMVNTVKGAAHFEQSTFTEVTKARSQWQDASNVDQQMSAAKGLDTALSHLLVTFESYPQLQATQAYRDLMTELEGTENRVAVARRDYNTAVQANNVLILHFPTNILAEVFGFRPATYFESVSGTEKPPAVNFFSE